MRFLAQLFIATGLFLLFVSFVLIYQRYNPQRLSFAVDAIEAQDATPKSEITPTRVTLERVGIDLPLHPAAIVNGEWEDTKKGASYLISSPVPGETGNSVIYGHNYPVLFGNLTRAVPRDVITITFSDGSVKKFEVLYTKTVDPTETGVIGKSTEKRLTLYTCTGFLDSKRFVVSSIPL